MNAGPADTRSPHLDLDDLIAGAAGQPAGDRAREHLARCADCQAEASRWNLVAGAVRGLAAATPEPAAPAWPRPARARVLDGPWRRHPLLAASVAAALVLLAGGGYWAATALTRPASRTVLTAVSGCTGTELASGTLERAGGTSLVIATAGGQRVTVTTPPSATVTVAGPLLNDITDGAAVTVIGPRSGAGIAAISVTVGPLPSKGTGKGNSTQSLSLPRGWTVARGTVAGAGASGFTVVVSAGARVPVTTSARTFVVVPQAGLGQLRDGVATAAVGQAGPDGTLTAVVVLQEPPGPLQVHVNVKSAGGCPPASVNHALAAALGAG
jgi:hypothetical protein